MPSGFWRGHYNTDRPLSSLGYRTLQEFAALRAAGHYSAGVGQGISNASRCPTPPSPLKAALKSNKVVVCSDERIRGEFSNQTAPRNVHESDLSAIYGERKQTPRIHVTLRKHPKG